MPSLNVATKLPPLFTAEGATAKRVTPLQELIRLTMACMLWEDGFYSDGKTVGVRIRELVHTVSLAEAAGVAIEAREKMKLRHVPLLIVREMARHPKRDLITNRSNGANHTSIISETLARVIQRPDELNEFCAIYWADGKQPLSKQVKLGLAKAFNKFSEYQLAKYNRKKDIMLRDVLFLCHSKPADVEKGHPDGEPWHQWTKAERKFANDPGFVNELRPLGFTPGELLYGKLIYDQLETPDTWEVELSAGADKKETFLRLMDENKLGDLAFLHNLRNILEAGVEVATIVSYGGLRKWGRVLPLRFIAAAKVVPQLEQYLEGWMFKCLEGSPKLPGKTILLADVSSSMQVRLSQKSDLTRDSAMKALAMLLREVCEDVQIIPFARGCVVDVPPRRGFALADLLHRHGGPDGTNIGDAVTYANHLGYDRLILLTDEQFHTRVPEPLKGTLAYCVNVAVEKHGVGYGSWLHIDGFSESIVDYIQRYEGGLQ